MIESHDVSAVRCIQLLYRQISPPKSTVTKLKLNDSKCLILLKSTCESPMNTFVK